MLDLTVPTYSGRAGEMQLWKASAIAPASIGSGARYLEVSTNHKV
jgi:hypothetical protein